MTSADRDVGPLVIVSLFNQSEEQNSTVACFYFDFAAPVSPLWTRWAPCWNVYLADYWREENLGLRILWRCYRPLHVKNTRSYCMYRSSRRINVKPSNQASWFIKHNTRQPVFAAVRGPSGAPRDGPAGDCGRPLGTARVMFHDATMIRSEVYDFNSLQYPNEMIGLSTLWVNSDK